MNEPLAPYGNAIAVKADWYDGKKLGIQVGEPVFVQQWWVPVIWDDEEDPEFHKEAGLDGVIRRAPSERERLVEKVVGAAKAMSNIDAKQRNTPDELEDQDPLADDMRISTPILFKAVAALQAYDESRPGARK